MYSRGKYRRYYSKRRIWKLSNFDICHFPILWRFLFYQQTFAVFLGKIFQFPVPTVVFSFSSGDLFLLVYSIDNRESFEEVERLCQQIQECKTQCRTQTGERRRKFGIPIVVVGNKCDREKSRVIDPSEALHLTEVYENCQFIEASAKKNINIEESFTRIFDLGNLPLEMSPSLHRKVHPFYVSGSSSPTGRRGMSIRRKMSDACGTIAPNVRRPSIRTDLMVAQMRTKTSAISKADVKDKCVIQWLLFQSDKIVSNVLPTVHLYAFLV